MNEPVATAQPASPAPKADFTPVRTVTGSSQDVPRVDHKTLQGREDQRLAASLAAMPTPGGVSPKTDPVAEANAPQKPTQNGKPIEPLAQRLALLAKRESAFVQKQRSWQAEQQRREAALKNQEEQLNLLRQEVEGFRKSMAEAKADPLKWLQAGGFDYDTATKAALNDGKLPPEELVARASNEMKSEVERLKAELKEREEKAAKEREENERKANEERQRHAQQAFANFQREAVEHVKQAGDKYKLLNLWNRQAEVPQLIDAHFRQTAQADAEQAKAEGRAPVGKILSYDEAADLLEKHYRETVESSYKHLYSTSQPAAPGAMPAAAPQPTVAPQNEQPGQRPSITNAVVSTPSSPFTAGAAMSEQERWARAMARLNQPGAVRDGRPA